MKPVGLFVPAIAAILTACGGSDPVARGEAFVVANCARCHATGDTGDGPHPDAPPFRLLKDRYPVAFLAEALAEGIGTGHPDMPAFVLQPDQIADVIAYLETL
jgi:cytochrome c